MPLPRNKPGHSRRSVLTLMAAAGAAALGLRSGLSSAQDKQLPPVTDSDPTAKALGYTDDASKVDKSKFPSFKPGSKCANCNFFQGKAGDARGPCQIFPGKSVNANGWCASHSPKAK
ncbi:MAG TPA: high-potential iron-sulfur protein [Steroidobacteraceae bacterium]|nr:high-potential iron-sulfur protein [Steroidobacteraceae bacterium]